MTDTPDPAAIAASLMKREGQFLKLLDLIYEHINQSEPAGEHWGVTHLMAPARSFERIGNLAEGLDPRLGRAVAAAIREAWQEPRTACGRYPPA